MYIVHNIMILSTYLPIVVHVGTLGETPDRLVIPPPLVTDPSIKNSWRNDQSVGKTSMAKLHVEAYTRS